VTRTTLGAGARPRAAYPRTGPASPLRDHHERQSLRLPPSESTREAGSRHSQIDENLSPAFMLDKLELNISHPCISEILID
jgi:hypothetical protein